MNKKNTILFIDDEKICHTLVELIIPNFTEFNLVNAYNGEEAVHLAHRYASSLVLILSDIMLPDFSGYEIYKTLKKDDRFKNIPFIFQSGLDSQEEELKKHISEPCTILYKPYKQADLLDAIETALNEVTKPNDKQK